MTNKDLRIRVRALGFGLSVSWKPEYQEYQVRIAGRPDATYFTSDQDDAFQTANVMAIHLTMENNRRASNDVDSEK